MAELPQSKSFLEANTPDSYGHQSASYAEPTKPIEVRYTYQHNPWIALDPGAGWFRRLIHRFRQWTGWTMDRT